MLAKNVSRVVMPLMLAIGLLVLTAPLFGQERPAIDITRIPPPGGGPDRMETIAGSVSGVNFKECGCKIVIYALGDVWYVQPFVAAPFTEIKEDGWFETKTHLGSSYAVLLVKASYRPPPATDTLPSVGGDVLKLVTAVAQYEGVASRSTVEQPDENPAVELSPTSLRDDIGASEDANPGQLTASWFGWWVVAACIFGVLFLIALSNQTERFVESIEGALKRITRGGEESPEMLLRGCVNWLSGSVIWQKPAATVQRSESAISPQPSDESATSAQSAPMTVTKAGHLQTRHESEQVVNYQPLAILKGFITLIIGLGAAYADFIILNETLSIVWPFKDTSWMLAASIVSLKALVGISLHMFNGKLSWVLLFSLLIMLLFGEFTFSYLRTIETEVARMAVIPSSKADTDAGSLIINDPSFNKKRVSDSSTFDIARDSTQTTSPDSPNHVYLSWYAILAGVITVICAMSETVGIYAGLRFSGVALVWIAASPLLLMLALPYVVLRLVNRSGVAYVISVILKATLIVMAKIWPLMQSLLYRLRGFLVSLPGVYRNWQETRIRHRERLKRLKKDLNAEREAEKQKREMISKWHDMADKLLEHLRSDISAAWKRVSERAAEQIAEAAATANDENSRSAAEYFAHDIVEMYRKTQNTFLSADGFHATDHHSADRNESKAGAPQVSEV